MNRYTPNQSISNGSTPNGYALRPTPSEYFGIFVYLECRGGRLHGVGTELIGEVYRLRERRAEAIGESGRLREGYKEKISVLAIGAGMDAVERELAGYPVDEAYLYETEDEYSPVHYEAIAASCIQKLKPSIVLIGGTDEGRALAPRLAVAFRTGLTADCTVLECTEEGNLLQIRPAFGGNVMAAILTPARRPQFATVRPGVMKAAQKRFVCETKKIRETIEKTDNRVEILGKRLVKEERGIAKQSRLVVAGRGVKKKEDLEMLWELARRLGGELAASRGLVEKGFLPSERQIGLSGQIVAPSLMITCGVSGTVQFAAGMKRTKEIIAINTEPNAPIFDIAHCPVCADLYEIVPELICRLR